jgi:diacylglycerol kinase family enzyme
MMLADSASDMSPSLVLAIGLIASTPPTRFMGTLHCIVNPASRDHTCGKRWPKTVIKLESKGFEVKSYITDSVGHAGEIAWKLRNDNVEGIIVAVGGDGTVHEVASALRGGEIPMGILPFGSGNDYAITQGISRKNIDAAIDVLVNGVDRKCAAWRLEGFPATSAGDYPAPKSNEWDGASKNEGRVVRWVFLESDAGITSAISRAKLYRAKWIKGSKKYTYLGITTIPFWKRRKVWLKLDDEEGQILDFSMFAATTGETFGGGYQVCPGVSPVDENGTIVYAPRLSRIAMLSLMGPMKKGKHIGKWGITQQKANRIEIKPVDKNGKVCEKPLPLSTWVQADGEPVIVSPATLEWHTEQLLVRGAVDVPWASE